MDAYVEDRLVGADPALDAALAASAAAGLPPIQVSAAQGKLLHLLALLTGARSVLEIGTLGGYSAIWLARAAARRPAAEPGDRPAACRGGPGQPGPGRGAPRWLSPRRAGG